MMLGLVQTSAPVLLTADDARSRAKNKQRLFEFQETPIAAAKNAREDCKALLQAALEKQTDLSWR